MVFATSQKPSVGCLIVNFGGPRSSEEIFPFLQELLCDRDVVRTKLPHFLHNYLFTRIARKRSLKIQKEYALMGGKSPIFFDTEKIASHLSEALQTPVLTFHRYLPATHPKALQDIEKSPYANIQVLPLFPQFTYATTGSIARFFARHLSKASLKKLRWISSYPDHPLFVTAMQQKIHAFLSEKNLNPKDIFLLFSAHGLPQEFIDTKDPYEQECQRAFKAILQGFPSTQGILAYQSKFGKGKWLTPYTQDLSENVLTWNQHKKAVVFIPLSFTSDHIETLIEIEHQYMPLIRQQGIQVYRCPALNLESYWLDALKTFFLTSCLFQRETHELFQ